MLPALLALSLAVAPLSAAPPEAVDAGWILARLARPAPMRTDFVELRNSKLLKQPLRISGEYRRPRSDVLVREVRSPYVETVTLGTGAGSRMEARIERPGKPVRTYPLSRVPELAAMQAGIGALLSGDRASIEKHYVLSPRGTRQAWTLRMTPRDARLAKSITAMTLHGRGAELRCIETTPATRGAPMQQTLLASAARGAGATLDATRVTALCHGSADTR